MITRPASARSWNLAFLAMLVLSLTICGVQAVAILRFHEPKPTVTAAVGQRISLNGVRYTVDEFVVGPVLAAKPDQPPVTAMPNAVLVGVSVTLEVDDPGRDTATLYCDFGLVDERGRRWSPDNDVGYGAALPDRTTCASGKDRPVLLGVPYRVGAVFMVPADAADGLRLRLRLPTDQAMVEFRR